MIIATILVAYLASHLLFPTSWKGRAIVYPMFAFAGFLLLFCLGILTNPEATLVVASAYKLGGQIESMVINTIMETLVAPFIIWFFIIEGIRWIISAFKKN